MPIERVGELDRASEVPDRERGLQAGLVLEGFRVVQAERAHSIPVLEARSLEAWGWRRRRSSVSSDGRDPTTPIAPSTPFAAEPLKCSQGGRGRQPHPTRDFGEGHGPVSAGQDVLDGGCRGRVHG